MFSTFNKFIVGPCQAFRLNYLRCLSSLRLVSIIYFYRFKDFHFYPLIFKIDSSSMSLDNFNIKIDDRN